MKKKIAIITIFMLLFQYFLPVISEINISFATITEENGVYNISTEEDLMEFAERVNSGENFLNCTIELKNDINLNSNDNIWTPIGDYNNPFKGTFDGNNHKIIGMNINQQSRYMGLFGYINRGTIKNLTISNSTIQAETNDISSTIGIIAGKIIDTDIYNCNTENSNIIITTGNTDCDVGGIIGEGSSNSNIINSCSNTKIEIYNGNNKRPQVGGIVGYLSGSNITNCNNMGKIQIDSYNNATGGIVGENYGKIKNCFNKGEIITIGTSNYNSVGTGGIVGANHSTVTDSYNAGNISATDYVGGITGTNFDEGDDVTNCYNTGKIGSIEANKYVGGITGRNGSTSNTGCYGAIIKNCYNIGEIFPTEGSVGNIVGYNKEKGTLVNCYYLSNNIPGYGINVSQENIEVYEKNETQMKNNNFIQELNKDTTNYNYDDYSNNNGYPILLWIDKIEIEKNPDKLSYRQNKANLDLTGGKVKLVRNYENYNEIIDITNELITVSGFDNSTIGKNTITVTYSDTEETFTTTFDVQITGPILESIEVTTKPTKLNYIQNYENLDLTDGILTLNYDYNETETISLTNPNIEINGFDNSKLGKNTITVKYMEKTTTFDVTIVEKQLTSIEIIQNPTKSKYIQNYESIDLTGGIIKVYYNDETTDTISMTNEKIEITGFDNSKLGENTLTVTYMGRTATFEVEIVKKEISKIEVTTTPTKANYIQNYESVDLTGGIVTVYYNDETTDTINMTNEKIELTGFDNSKLGKNTLTVTYMGRTATFEVEIIEKEISKIEVTENPTKLNYIQNYESLDLTGGILTVYYNDETTDTISVTNEKVEVTGFDNSKLGKNTLKVTYMEKTTTFDVTIVEKEILKIEVTANPTKLKYIQNYEKLDLTGGIITIYYNDETTDTINMTNEKIEVTGFDNTKLGKNTIKATYIGVSTTFEVEIVEKQITNIEIKSKPIKLSYIQNYEKLDLTGGIITIYYNDETTDTISMTNEQIKVMGFNNTNLGKNTLTVTYMEKTITFDIEIHAKSIIKIELTSPINKLEYKQNQEILDLTGGILTIYYNDKTTEKMKLTDKKIEVIGFDNSKIGKNKITVKYGGFTTTFNVNIIKNNIDTTISNKPIPNAGIKIEFIVFITIIIVSYILYKKYSDIQIK